MSQVLQLRHLRWKGIESVVGESQIAQVLHMFDLTRYLSTNVILVQVENCIMRFGSGRSWLRLKAGEVIVAIEGETVIEE